jgi:phosphate transport system substrate-binding protein
MTAGAGDTPTPPPTAPPSPPPAVVRRKSGRGLWAVVGVVVIVVVLVGVGLGTNWYGLQKSSSSSSSTACTTGVTLEGAGASFLNAVMSTWKTGYASATGNQVDYTASSAGAGITSLADKLVDFAATDEPLNTSDVAQMPGTVFTLPVTGGPVAIVYNLPGYGHTLNITPVELVGIYNGTITNWNDSALASNNPGLPNQPIVSVHRSDQAGTTYVLTNLFSIYNSAWKNGTGLGTTVLPTPWPSTPNQLAEKGNSALGKTVSSTKYSIGYIDLPDAINDKLATAGVLNSAGHYVQPTVASTEGAINNLSGQKIPAATGDWSTVSWVNSPGTFDYPLATLSYFIVLQDPHLGFTSSLANAQVLIQWLHYVLTTGQTQSAGVDYVNPPANIVQQDLSALGTMVYNSASIPACT